MSTKRFKLFQRILRAQDAAASTTTSTAPTTIPGSPREVQVDTYFPTFAAAWGAIYKEPVNELLSALNWSIFSLSIGQLDLEHLREIHFVIDSSKYPDPFLMGVVGFASAVYNQILNGGKPFTTQVGNKREIINNLKNLISTNNKIPDSLGPAFPQPFLQTKIGNFKPKVISILTRMDALSA